jgi:hypothetical protein
MVVTMTISGSTVKWQVSSDWPLLAGVVDRIECISIEVPAADSQSRWRYAIDAADEMSRAVDARRWAKPMLLISSQPTQANASSRSARLRMRRGGFFSGVSHSGYFLDSLGARDCFEFEIFKDSMVRRCLAFVPTDDEWGLAVRMMLELPTFGVFYRQSIEEDFVINIARQAFAGRGGIPMSGRQQHLISVFNAQNSDVVGVFTATGQFDDPYLGVEYHRIFSDGLCITASGTTSP